MAREYTTIVLHIEKEKAEEFEKLFESDELKRGTTTRREDVFWRLD
jgi:hypothetical protein